MTVKIDHDFAAGLAAGRDWALGGELGGDKLQIARLRSWSSMLIETDAWEYSSVYASLLTNKLVVDNTGKAGDNELFLAAEEAQWEARSFWQQFDGWNEHDENAQWNFVEGFVRGAVGAETLRRSLG
jgi:hypothetical protein